MKITECKNKAVELRKEYGYFFTTGNTKAKGKWDLNYKFSFLYLNTRARSYNLEPNGSDTLPHICNKWFSYKLRRWCPKNIYIN